MIPADKIRVTVSKGWVTLKGEVDWQFQKVDAERVVRRVGGVKGVTNLIVVKPSLEPTKLKEKIGEALKRSAETDARRITVEVDGSRVILKGTVRSWAEKQEAERVAWAAPGATAVENQIIGLAVDLRQSTRYETIMREPKAPFDLRSCVASTSGRDPWRVSNTGCSR